MIQVNQRVKIISEDVLHWSLDLVRIDDPNKITNIVDFTLPDEEGLGAVDEAREAQFRSAFQGSDFQRLHDLSFTPSWSDPWARAKGPTGPPWLVTASLKR